MEKVILKPADIAPLLGVTTGRVYQLISEGVIPAVRIGSAVRIPRAAWESWVHEQSARALAIPEPAGVRPQPPAAATTP